MSKESIAFFDKKLPIRQTFRKVGDREKELQKNSVPRPQPLTFRDNFIKAGDSGFDPDRYIDSEFGENLMTLFETYACYPDEDGEEVISYWRERGLVKTVYNMDQPEKKWAAFVPVEAYEHPEKKYPVVYCIHGNGADVFRVESYGFCHLAGKEKFIVIIPQDAEDTFDALYAEVLEKFPVDPSRIYIMGFSYGGWIVNRAGVSMIDKFAAGTSGGVMYNGFDGNNGYRKMHFTEEERQNAYQKHFPMAFITGLNESNQFLPYHKQKDEVTNLKDKLYGTIFWRRVNGCEEPTFEEAASISYSTANSVEMKLGTKCDKTYVQILDGVEYYFGEVQSKDGIVRLMHVGIENGPHVASPSFAKISWDFMKHFSRDPKTGKSVYSE